MTIKIYVEGGGDDNNALRTACRKGFSSFFEKAGLKGKMPRIIACGGRQQAFDDFCTALDNSSGEFIALLVDSENAITNGHNNWEHLQNRDGWQKPSQATEENVHLMIQCMETWFLADKNALARYFGDGYRQNALPANPNIESIPKDDILNGLKNAARETLKKGYDKGTHSFIILGQIDPDLVLKASPEAKNMVDILIKSA